MSYAVFMTAAGWMAVRASATGLTDVILPRPAKEAVLDELGVRDDGDTAYFTDLIHRINAYFNGEAVDFPDAVDASSGTPFQQDVWEACRRIPRGSTRSYRQLAGDTGRPGAARATGSALGKNPIPLVIPCHRVIAADGTLGGFSGGLDMKRRMLGLEKVSLPERGSR